MSVVPGEVSGGDGRAGAAIGGIGIGAQQVKETLVVRAQPYLWFPCGMWAPIPGFRV